MTVCDRCKEPLSDGSVSLIAAHGGYGVDLCRGCFFAFKQWIAAGKPVKEAVGGGALRA